MIASLFLTTALNLAMAPCAQAAIPEQGPLSAIEVLSLPEFERVETAKAQNLYPQLIEMAFASERSVQTRWKSLVLAAQIKQDDSWPEIQKALKQSDWFMRNAALMATQKISAQKTQEVALKLVHDPALVVRSAALQALDENMADQGRSELWAELNAEHNIHEGQNLWLRKQILRKLAAHAHSDEYPQFVRLLHDKDEHLYLAAITGLEQITKKYFGDQQSPAAQKQKLWLAYIQKRQP